MKAPNIVTLLASAVRTATQNVDVHAALTPQYTALTVLDTSVPVPATNVMVYLNVTSAPTIETLILKMQEQNPVSLAWSDVAGAASLAQVATGLIKLVVSPTVINVAAAVTGVTLNTLVPPIWRIVVAHSASGNWTYSLSAAIEV
tara:strand:+ start:115 stop:549 length:435 start_codon:yes stop_codon:yes gene_type:complete